MASQNYPQNYSVSDFEVCCDVCNSPEIVETEQGYVCASCGVVLEIQKLEYHRPYKEERVQHAVLGSTQIGYVRERSQNKHSRRFHKLNKISKSSNATPQPDIAAIVTIGRLLENLNLPSSLKQPIFAKYKQAREEFPPSTKFRNPEKLVPGVLYFHCKINCLPIDERKLLEYAGIEKSEFQQLKLRAVRIMPKYYSRDRQEYILNRIMQVKQEYHLSMDFYHEARAILLKLWEGIKCTKDDVIAGLVSSIVILCRYQYDINVNSLCNTLNIQMSTIQSQVKRKIIDRFQVPGFESLVRSADLLRDVMSKLGLIEVEAKELQSDMSEKVVEIKSETIEEKEAICQKESEADLVYVNMEEVMPRVEITAKSQDHFMFAIKDELTLEPILVSVRVPRSQIQNKTPKMKKEHIEFEISRYHFAKGPPSICA